MSTVKTVLHGYVTLILYNLLLSMGDDDSNTKLMIILNFRDFVIVFAFETTER